MNTKGFDCIPADEHMYGYRATAEDGTIVEVARVESGRWQVFTTYTNDMMDASASTSAALAMTFARECVKGHGGFKRS